MPDKIKRSVLLEDLLGATNDTEGLLPGQLPLRITNDTMRLWKTIHGVPVDQEAMKNSPANRKNFFYVEPSKTGEVIKKQYDRYITKPEKYGLSPESTLEDVVKKFDQENPQNKTQNLQKKGYDLKKKIKDIDLLSMLGPTTAYAAETEQAKPAEQQTPPQSIPELQKFRAKYPMYSNLDDVTVADKLAKKYPQSYAALPRKVAEYDDKKFQVAGGKLMEEWTGIPAATWDSANFKPTGDAWEDSKKVGTALLMTLNAAYEPVERAIHYPTASAAHNILQERKPVLSSLWDATASLRKTSLTPEERFTWFDVFRQYNKDLNKIHNLPEDYTHPYDRPTELIGGLAARFLMPDILSMGKKAITNSGKATFKEAVDTLKLGKDATVEQLNKLTTYLDDLSEWRRFVSSVRKDYPAKQAEGIIKAAKELKHHFETYPVSGGPTSPAQSRMPQIIPGVLSEVTLPSQTVGQVIEKISKANLPKASTATKPLFKSGAKVTDIAGGKGIVKSSSIDPGTGIRFYIVDYGPEAPAAQMSEGTLKNSQLDKPKKEPLVATPNVPRETMPSPTATESALPPITEETTLEDALIQGLKEYARNPGYEWGEMKVKTPRVRVPMVNKGGKHLTLEEAVQQQEEPYKQEYAGEKGAPTYGVYYRGDLVRFVNAQDEEEVGIIKNTPTARQDSVAIMLKDGTELSIPSEDMITIPRIDRSNFELPQPTVPRQAPNAVSQLVNEGKLEARKVYKQIMKSIYRAKLGNLTIHDLAKINRMAPGELTKEIAQDVWSELVASDSYDSSQPIDHWLNKTIKGRVINQLLRYSVQPEFSQTKYAKEQINMVEEVEQELELTLGQPPTEMELRQGVIMEMSARKLKAKLHRPATPEELNELVAKTKLTRDQLRLMQAARRTKTVASVEEMLDLGIDPSVPKPAQKAKAPSPEQQLFGRGPIEFYSGIPIPKELIELGTRVIQELIIAATHPDPTFVTDVFAAIHKWFGEGNVGALLGNWAMEDMIKIVPQEERRNLISKAIENPTLISSLQPNERALYEWVKKQYATLAGLAKQEKIMEAFRENYVTHIYRDNNDKVSRALYPSGGKLGAKFRFAKQRHFPTFAAAEEAGLHPIYDISVLYANYIGQLYRTIANKKFIETLKLMKNENGEPILMRSDKAPGNYITIHEPAFARYMYVGEAGERDIPLLVKVPIKADPRVAHILDGLIRPIFPYSRWLKHYSEARGFVKRLLMWNPLFAGGNVLSDVLKENNMNIFKAVTGLVRAHNMFKNHDARIEEMVRSGLNLSVVWDRWNEMHERLSGLEETQGLKGAYNKLIKWNDKILWGWIVQNSSILIYNVVKARTQSTAPTLTNEQAGRIAARYTNDIMGSLPNHLFSAIERELSSMLLFARNWTIGNARLFTGMFTPGSPGGFGGGFNPRMFKHQGYSPEEAKVVRRMYIENIIRNIVYFFISNNIIQMSILQLRGKPVHTTLKNERGHKWDLDIGVRDYSGRPVYVSSFLFRFIGDYLAFATAFSQMDFKILWNKVEPMLKASIETGTNNVIFTNKPVTMESNPLLNLRDKLAHVGVGITPWRSIGGISDALTGGEPTAEFGGKLLLPMEKFWLPIFGMYTRHGLVFPASVFDTMSKQDKGLFYDGLVPKERKEFDQQLSKGLIEGTLAHDFLQFRQKRSMDHQDIAKEVGLLMQKGKTKEATKLMEGAGLGPQSISLKLQQWEQRTKSRTLPTPH